MSEYFPIGTHMHNFLPWNLDEFKDSCHPKWWQMKEKEDGSCVILVKNNASYSAFHGDADIIHRLCGSSYGGNYIAETTFSVEKLNDYRSKLVSNGHSVRIMYNS